MVCHGGRSLVKTVRTVRRGRRPPPMAPDLSVNGYKQLDTPYSEYEYCTERNMDLLCDLLITRHSRRNKKSCPVVELLMTTKSSNGASLATNDGHGFAWIACCKKKMVVAVFARGSQQPSINGVDPMACR